MADTIGYLCEALVKVALSQTAIRSTFHDLGGNQDLVDCLSHCEYRRTCNRQNRKPKLRVEPDFVLHLDHPVFLYVTHAESSNILNFKLWRTLGEIIEQRKYVSDSLCADFLFGSIREKQEVYPGFEIISDFSKRIGDGEDFEKIKTLFARKFKGRMSVDVIAKWIFDERSNHKVLGRLIEETKLALESIDLENGNNSIARSQQNIFRKICSNASWNADVPPGDVGGHVRVAAILATVILEACGGLREPLLNCILGDEAALPQKAPWYRKRGDIYLPVWTISEQIDSDSITLAEEIGNATQLFDSADEFVEFCALYRQALQKDATWAVYIEHVGSWDICLKSVSDIGACWGDSTKLAALLRKAFVGQGVFLSVEIIATFLGQSVNRLAQSLEDQLQISHEVALKRFAPHGDDSIHVLSYLNRGRADELRFNLIPKSIFLEWLIESLGKKWIDLSAGRKVPSAGEVSQLFRYRLLKTMLTRAPSPLIASIASLCNEKLLGAGFIRDSNILSPTYLNDILRGKILRAGVAVTYKLGESRLSFMVSSTSEGNDLHKQKEYAAKVVAKKIVSVKTDEGFHLKLRPLDITIFVLDGSWPEDAQRFLYESGADLIVTFQTFHKLAPFLDEIIEIIQN